MKKQRNHSQLNDQEKSPERANNETDLTDTDFKMEIMSRHLGINVQKSSVHVLAMYLPKSVP